MVVGQMNLAEGNSSFVTGYNNLATTANQTVVGQFNAPDIDAKFIVGNGTSENDRKNAFVVKNNGAVIADNKELATKEEVPTNLQNGTQTKSLYQKTEKDDTALPLKFGEIHPDVKEQIEKDTYNKIEETGENATSLGTSIAKGKRSFAGGSSNLSTGKASITLGADNYNAGHNTAMFGYANTTTLEKDGDDNPLGSYGLVGGSKHILRNNNQTVGGHGNDVTGHCASAFGDGLIVKGYGQTVIGKFN